VKEHYENHSLWTLSYLLVLVILLSFSAPAQLALLLLSVPVVGRGNHDDKTLFCSHVDSTRLGYDVPFIT
jgi:hypothetical protein